MSVLRNLEAKLESLVEGAFGRAFKSHVQPVELAHKLVREMEEHKTQSISRTYVPNHYVVFLSADDREQFASWEDALRKELSDYLLEHARAEGLSLVSRPLVELETDDRLGLGEFGIMAQLVRPAEDEDAEPALGDFGHTMVYSPDRAPRPLAGARGDAPRRALLVGDDKRVVLDGDRVVIGRSRECELRLDDPNVSRRHAQLVSDGGAWIVEDLGSTNGIRVNGRRVPSAELRPGDELMLGLTRLTFEVE